MAPSLVLPLIEKSCRAQLGLGARVRGQGQGAGIAPGAAHFSPLKTYLSKETTEQSHSFPGLCCPQTAGPSLQWGLRGGREVEICKMSVGGEERRFVWGWGPGHWSALGPPATPRMLPLVGRAELASPRPAQGPRSPCAHCVQASGTQVPGAAQPLRARALGGRPPRASPCFSTGRSGAPMSWRLCPVPWPRWSWEAGSVSPGAPPWTSSKTLGVGVGPSQEGCQEAPTPGLSGGLPLASACGAVIMYLPQSSPLVGSGVGAGAAPESRCWRRRGAQAQGP